MACTRSSSPAKSSAAGCSVLTATSIAALLGGFAVRIRLQLGDGLVERADRAEGLASQHAVEELDAEVLLEREHEVHGRQRREPRLVEVAVVAELVDRHLQARVLREERADLL